MSQVSAQPSKLLAKHTLSLPAGFGRTLWLALLVVGGVCALITLATVVRGGDGDVPIARVALASYHIGFLVVMGVALGALAFTMILHQVNAGWSALIRRQVEHVMSMIFPTCLLLFLPILLSVFLAPGMLWKWMDPSYVAGDVIYDQKAVYLNVPFFTLRALVYFAVWSILAGMLYRYSIKQDSTADRWLTAKARRMSSYGLLLFAFTVAFASFDWMMSMDFHWFSTMFGVYFFAGAFGAGLATVILALLALRRTARLGSLITQEHLHDMGKLLFGFVVFWAYIGFSQYFLIWYANIPEETAWFVRRREDGWFDYSVALAVCRFIIPFIVLMPRPWRRSPLVLAGVASWILLCHILDVFWVIRPDVTASGGRAVLLHWIDIVAIAGPVCIFAGLMIRKIVSGPLTPTNDPRLAESVRHTNYI